MVIVLDKRKRPIGFMTERRARKMMEQRRACIYRQFPTIIIMKDMDAREFPSPEPCRIKIDPGAKHTGIAVVNSRDEVMLFMQIEHRGYAVKKKLETRARARRNRRTRETWYRHPKWGNSQKKKDAKADCDSSRPDGWISPSLRSVGDNIISWVDKLCKWINIDSCSFEAVRFDTQLIDNPDICGEEYQHGELEGVELREYLMERYQHTCQYCGGASGDPILEWEHKVPKSRGGTDKLSNATLSCRKCNQAKGNLTPEEWKAKIEQSVAKKKANGKEPSTLEAARLLSIGKVIEGRDNGLSDRYCAWTNATRRHVEKGLFERFGDVECSSGGRTKYNRTQLGYPKDHHFDALCVGTVPKDGYTNINQKCLYVTAMGRGTRFRGKINASGVIVKKLGPRPKRVFGFMNGDIVRAEVPKGKYAGTHIGRVMTRASGAFSIRTTDNRLVVSNYRYCRIIQYNDGYKYAYASAIPLGN